MDRLSENAIEHILGIFRQLIAAEYQVHLFDLHREMPKEKVDVQSQYQQYADQFCRQLTDQQQSEEVAFRQSLCDVVNTYQSDLFSLINAIHKSKVIHQAYGQYYPFVLDYEAIKSACFEKVKYFSEKYQGGHIDPLHSQKIPTFGLKYEQANVHFDPHYYYFKLHHYFNQVECHQITLEDLEGDQENFFSFKFLLFPLFLNKKDRPVNYTELVDAIIDGYFVAPSKSLSEKRSHWLFVKKNQKSVVNTVIDSQGRKRNIRQSQFDSAFAYKTYPQINLTDYADDDLLSVLFNDYDDKIMGFKDPDLLVEQGRTQKAYSCFVHPIQFVFSTRKAKQHIPHIKASLLYTGDQLLWRYLNSDRTGYWLNTFLLDHLLITRNEQYINLLAYVSPEMKFTDLLAFLAQQNFYTKNPDNREQYIDYNLYRNVLPPVHQQFASVYFGGEYLREKGDVENEVLQKVAAKYAIDKNAVTLSPAAFKAKLAESDCQLNIKSLHSLLDSTFNVSYSSLAKQEAMADVGLANLIFIPELSFNSVDYEWINWLYQSLMELYEQTFKRMKVEPHLSGLLMLKEGIRELGWVDLYARPKQLIKPLILFSLKLDDEFLDESIDDLVFDADKQFCSMTLNTFLFLDDPFKQEEKTCRKFHLNDKNADISLKLPVTQNQFKLLQGWKMYHRYFELAMNDEVLKKRLQNCFSGKVLCNERLKNQYILTDEIDIMLSINI